MGSAAKSSEWAVARRIAAAFLDFLGSVEPAPGVDAEAIEVARDCLETTFGTNLLSADEKPPPDLLWDLFRSRTYPEQKQKARPRDGSDAVQSNASTSVPAPEKSGSQQNPESVNIGGLGNGYFKLDSSTRDELFARIYDALDRIDFYRSPSGDEDTGQVNKAMQILDDVSAEMKSSGRETITIPEIAEFFKLRGNLFMQSKEHREAAELYTCAIALCPTSSVYYCNRAAAYTHLRKYAEAIEDCEKAISIDPAYTKAYSRLGSAYFAEGKYHDALQKGYYKALQLDPGNSIILENIKVAKLKLEEQTQRARSSVHISASGTSSLTPDMAADVMRSFASFSGGQPFPSSSPPQNGSTTTTQEEVARILSQMSYSWPEGSSDHRTTNSGSPASGSNDAEIPHQDQSYFGVGSMDPVNVVNSVMRLFSPPTGPQPDARPDGPS